MSDPQRPHGLQPSRLLHPWDFPGKSTIQEYIQKNSEELYKKEYIQKNYTKKDLHDLDNHDGVITHLEPDILECKVKWALGGITTNKASGGDRISD